MDQTAGAGQWQFTGGYGKPYDWAFKAGTHAEAYEFPFEYDHKSYVVWMWKGEYWNMGDGAEIEFLRQDVPLAKAGPWWKADPSDPNLPKLTETLSDKSSPIASFAPDRAQVWTGSWNENKFDPVSDLKVRATAAFGNAEMFKAFKKTEEDVVGNPWHFNSDTKTATINY